MRSAEGAGAWGAVGARSPQAEASASAHTRSTTTRGRAAFIGLPSPLGRREFGGTRRNGGGPPRGTGDNLLASGPHVREAGHDRVPPRLSNRIPPRPPSR